MRTLLGGDLTSHVHEVSYVDPASKRVIMCSTNLTWSNAISVKETVVYEPHPTLPDTKTQFKQEAKITALCGGWQKIKNGIEEATMERFGQNAERGREGFETVLEISRRVFGEQRELERREKQLAKTSDGWHRHKTTASRPPYSSHHTRLNIHLLS